MQCVPVFVILNVRADVNACDCTDTGAVQRTKYEHHRESALKIDSGKNILLPTRDSNPRQKRRTRLSVH